MDNKFNVSVLEKIIQDIYQCKDLETGKKLMKEFLDETKIKDIDKRKMLFELDNIQTINKLHFYVTNAMFKFEGLGVTEFKNIK